MMIIYISDVHAGAASQGKFIHRQNQRRRKAAVIVLGDWIDNSREQGCVFSPSGMMPQNRLRWQLKCADKG